MYNDNLSKDNLSGTDAAPVTDEADISRVEETAASVIASADAPAETAEADTKTDTSEASVETAETIEESAEPAEEPVQHEPTMTFDSVQKPADVKSSTGIKVFFAMLSVTVVIILAVTAGYILGKQTPDNTLKFISPSLQGKGENAAVSDYNDVFNTINKSVVSIETYNKTDSGVSYASGVIYSEDGYIVTNDHIYSEISSPEFMVTLYDGREFKAEYVAGDTRSDLAVLKITATKLVPAVFGDSDECVPGEEVLAVGYSSGTAGKPILTTGIVSAPSIRVSSSASTYTMKMIQTDTAINPGSSGGALANMYSQVVGITSAKLAGTMYESIGYAIPSATVVKIADSLILNGYVADRGKLGISFTEVNSVVADINDLPKGLRVEIISPESCFNGTSVKVGDIITHINDTEINASTVALDIIESAKPDEKLTFTVYHADTKTSETILGKLLADQGSSSYSNKLPSGGGNTEGMLPYDDSGDSFSDFKK